MLNAEETHAEVIRLLAKLIARKWREKQQRLAEEAAAK